MEIGPETAPGALCNLADEYPEFDACYSRDRPVGTIDSILEPNADVVGSSASKTFPVAHARLRPPPATYQRGLLSARFKFTARR